MTPRLLRWLPLLVALLATPAFGATDVAGWRDVRWGMPVEEALRQFERVHVVQRTKIELNGCYVTYAVPIELFDEAWHAWMCEDRSAPVVVAVHIESAADSSARFEDILGGMVSAYGLPHRVWSNCMNAVGRPTVQVRWYFPSTTITLLNRDLDQGWVMMRYARPVAGPEFGPGVCWAPPIDPRAPVS